MHPRKGSSSRRSHGNFTGESLRALGRGSESGKSPAYHRCGLAGVPVHRSDFSTQHPEFVPDSVPSDACRDHQTGSACVSVSGKRVVSHSCLSNHSIHYGANKTPFNRRTAANGSPQSACVITRPDERFTRALRASIYADRRNCQA